MRLKEEREIWVDNVKVIACFFVVMGHFFQSMTKAKILPENEIYQWFNQTVYYFHVPLFFICSGYLYQKLSCVNTIQSWKRNILKKTITLGIPYFTFSFTTWLLKMFFSSSVNDQIGGLADTLFLHPTSPYWYLYCLFFVFLITPTFSDKKMAIVGGVIAFAMKIAVSMEGCSVQVIVYIFSYEIWFVIGMCLHIFVFSKYVKANKSCTIFAALIGLVFMMLSMMMYIFELHFLGQELILGLMACFTVVVIVIYISNKNGQNAVWKYLSMYTLPIFLMHTLFAAPIRVILLKVGIRNLSIHMFFGILISFAGPIAAAWIMKKWNCMNFFLYPGKYLRKRGNRL